NCTWMMRAPFVPVTCPKFTELKFVETLEYCVWFKAFCMSALNSSVRPSPREKFLPRERFKLEYPGIRSGELLSCPRRAVRPEAVTTGNCTKAARFRYCRFPKPQQFLFTAPSISIRSGRPPICVTFRGSPVVALTIPAICHPPRTCLAIAEFRKGDGISYNVVRNRADLQRIRSPYALRRAERNAP